MRRELLALVVVAASAGPAYALKPSAHHSITLDACTAAGFADDFCERVAAEAYDTDANEWDDLSAHAQIAAGQTPCDAANAAVARVAALGQTVRVSIAALGGTIDYPDSSSAAQALGRAIHTIQDNCAHHGQTNPQHAWASLSDFCSSTNLSPDTQPEALACARDETARVFQSVRAAFDAGGVRVDELIGGCPPPGSNDTHNDPFGDPCRMYLPTPGQACDFLETAQAWNGVDTRWNDDVVIPILHAALLDAIATGAVPGDACGGVPNALAIAPAAAVDVSNGPTTCPGAHLLCLGKADSADEAADFFEERTAERGGGCAAASGGIGIGVALFVIALAVRRKRA